MNYCWAHWQHPYLLHGLVGQQVSVGNFWSIFFMLAHEVFVWWKEWLPLIHVHLVKVAAVNLRKLVLLPLESSQVSHAYVRSILWSGDLQPSFHMCSEHTKPLIDLFKEKKFLLKSMPYARILISSLMVPHLNSVVFYYKTTTWSCLSGTACSHVCSRTSSCFGAYYRSSFPENLADRKSVV